MRQFSFEHIVNQELVGKRLDQALAELIPIHSRSRIQSWIKSGQVTVNNKIQKQRSLLASEDHIRINAQFEETGNHVPEDIPLAVIYEDEYLAVINKPAGLVIHPGAGNPGHTLVNALLHYDPGLARVPRAGIVHRLDKGTTGILLIARTPRAHTSLLEQLQRRQIVREYQAVVCGRVTAGNTIERNIGRHSTKRKRMAVTENGKPAVTHYRLIERFSHYSHIRVKLETGRTHQIRVHMAHVNHPLVGDPVYGRNQSLRKGVNGETRTAIARFKRQALHAFSLAFAHPASAERCQFEAALPEDLQALLNDLEQYDGE